MSTKSYSKHGGARKGAGKPAQFEKPMKRKEVMLPDEAIDFFLALGEGNLSAGVRQAWRSLTRRAADGYACDVENCKGAGVIHLCENHGL